VIRLGIPRFENYVYLPLLVVNNILAWVYNLTPKPMDIFNVFMLQISFFQAFLEFITSLLILKYCSQERYFLLFRALAAFQMDPC
jgi:hypothetical protein